MKNRYIFSNIPVTSVSEDTAYELVRTGMQYTDRYGDFHFSKNQLEDMAKNFNANVQGQEVAVDINHDPERRAYAWIKPESMYVAPSKLNEGEYSLFAQLYNFTPEGADIIQTGAFRYFSIEYVKTLNTWIDGVKRSVKNVILGLALTNRPAVKGLAPTFSEINQSNMLNKLLTALKEREIVSKADKDMLTMLLSDVPEEELAPLQEDIDAVQAKPEEKEEEVAEVVAEEVVEEEAEAKADAPEEAQLSEVITLKEKNEEMSRQLSELMAEKMEREITDCFSALVLSNDNPNGFVVTSAEKVKDFLRTLSADQRATFSELVKEVKNVDLSVRGTEEFADTSEVEMEKKAQKRAEEIMAGDKKMKKFDALTVAYKELGMTKSTN